MFLADFFPILGVLEELVEWLEIPLFADTAGWRVR